MAEAVRACEYALIRVYPDPIRKEFLNIGVCLFDRVGGFAEVRVVDNFRRLRCLFPAFDFAVLRGLEHDLRSVLRGRQGAFDPDHLFYLAGETFAQSLELSPRHGLLTADPAQALADLFARYVANPPAAPGTERRAWSVRRGILAELRNAFAEEGILGADKLHQRVLPASFGAGPDPYRFDFHYRPNGVHNLIQALDLEDDTRGVRVLSSTVGSLRDEVGRKGLGLAAIAVHSGAEDGGLAGYHKEILAAARIGLHPVTAAGELAAHIRAELRL